jgi:DNA-binding transcriptional MerR regulator
MRFRDEPTLDFSTAEVAAMTGLTVRQLDHWARRGIFLPSVQQAQGSGTRSRYSFGDVIQLRSLYRLKCRRWSTQKLGEVLGLIREVIDDPNPLHHALLVGDNHTLLVFCRTKQGEQIMLDGLKAGGQLVLSLVIEVVEDETRQILRNLSEQKGL